MFKKSPLVFVLLSSLLFVLLLAGCAGKTGTNESAAPANDRSTAQAAQTAEDKTTAAPEADETDAEAACEPDTAEESFVAVRFFKDAGIDPSAMDSVVLSETESAENLVFIASGTVNDFKILSLSLQSIDDNGKLIFETEPLYEQETLRPDRPLAADVTFIGDIPNLGFSYRDQNGVQYTFSIEISGMDGSLILTEI